MKNDNATLCALPRQWIVLCKWEIINSFEVTFFCDAFLSWMLHNSNDSFIEQISGVNSHLSSGQEAKFRIKKHLLSSKLYLIRGYWGSVSELFITSFSIKSLLASFILTVPCTHAHLLSALHPVLSYSSDFHTSIELLLYFVFLTRRYRKAVHTW